MAKYRTEIELPLAARDVDVVVEEVRAIAYPKLVIEFESDDLYELRERVSELELSLDSYYGGGFRIARPKKMAP